MNVHVAVFDSKNLHEIENSIVSSATETRQVSIQPYNLISCAIWKHYFHVKM